VLINHPRILLLVLSEHDPDDGDSFYTWMDENLTRFHGIRL